jgi:REP element-mobilizing transposase RayT
MKQVAMTFRTWGGKRRGAGRKQVNARKSQPHRTRPPLGRNSAVHVTLRVVDRIRRLRTRDAYRAIRRAMVVVLPRTDFRIVHASIQHNHIHLLVEADSKHALARGVQAFQISAARQLNAAAGTRGPVFVDRYHAEPIGSPRHARHCLVYVLNNWRRHKEDRSARAKTWQIDPYSSAIRFTGWAGQPVWEVPTWYEPLPVCPPQGWILATGWKRHGEIQLEEVPGPRA